MAQKRFKECLRNSVSWQQSCIYKKKKIINALHDVLLNYKVNLLLYVIFRPVSGH